MKHVTQIQAFARRRLARQLVHQLRSALERSTSSADASASPPVQRRVHRSGRAYVHQLSSTTLPSPPSRSDGAVQQLTEEPMLADSSSPPSEHAVFLVGGGSAVDGSGSAVDGSGSAVDGSGDEGSDNSLTPSEVEEVEERERARFGKLWGTPPAHMWSASASARAEVEERERAFEERRRAFEDDSRAHEERLRAFEDRARAYLLRDRTSEAQLTTPPQLVYRQDTPRSTPTDGSWSGGRDSHGQPRAYHAQRHRAAVRIQRGWQGTRPSPPGSTIALDGRSTSGIFTSVRIEAVDGVIVEELFCLRCGCAGLIGRDDLCSTCSSQPPSNPSQTNIATALLTFTVAPQCK